MTAHPLDVELADLVDGVLEPARVGTVEAHLEGCLLCRLKRRRLEGSPAPAGGPWPDPRPPLPAPAFAVPEGDAGAEPAAGELWLAGGDDRLLVLLRSVAGRRVTAAPVTLDVGAADDEALVVDAPPFHTRVVVHPALATEIPRAALTARLGSLSLAGGTPGPPVAGPADPRLELRQHLVDRLGALADAPAGADGLPGPGQVRSTLVADLRALRGRACTVRGLTGWDGLVLAEARGWEPLATVDEVGVVLVVLDTPHGLEDELDYDAARSVLTRRNASALVVTSTGLSELADVFDAAALHAGIDLPSGAHGPPRPLISGLAPFDAVAKYLDQHSGTLAMTPAARGPVARVEVAEVLREAAAAAAGGAARQGARFKIAAKRTGYQSLAGDEAAIAGALATAFEGGSVVEALRELASE